MANFIENNVFLKNHSIIRYIELFILFILRSEDLDMRVDM